MSTADIHRIIWRVASGLAFVVAALSVWDVMPPPPSWVLWAFIATSCMHEAARTHDGKERT